MSIAVKKKTMPCTECSEKFSEDDIDHGRFYPSTMTCKSCYQKLQGQSAKVSCFGKITKVKHGKTIVYGYDPKAPECSKECPDRKICRAFVKVRTDEKATEAV
jgi:hypothetical protein